MKKTLFLICILILIIMSFSFGQDSELEIYYNDELIKFATKPIIKDDIVLVPMRQFFESLDANINWISDTKQVLAYKGNMFIKLQIDNKEVYKNGKKLNLKHKPILNNQRTLVPIEFVAKTFDMSFDWDKEKNIIKINNKYRDNVYSLLGKTFFKKYYIENEQVEFSLPSTWKKISDNKYEYNYLDLRKLQLNISKDYLNDLSLKEHIENTKEKLSSDISILEEKDVSINDINFKKIFIEKNENNSKSVLYFFTYQNKVYLFNFSYQGKIEDQDALSLIEKIINSVSISTLSINEKNEHYIEFLNFFKYKFNLTSDIYANKSINNHFHFEGSIESNKIERIFVTVSKNDRSREYIIPIKNNKFNKKIYTPFGLGKHNVTVTLDSLDESLKNKSIITLNNKNSSIIMKFSVLNLENKKMLYLLSNQLILSDNNEIQSAANLISINDETKYEQAESIYEWVVQNFNLIEKNKEKENLNDSLTTFNKSEGTNLELNLLYTSLLRSIDIPTRIRKLRDNEKNLHYQTEMKINGKWIITNLYEEFKYKKKQEFSDFIYFDIYDQNYFDRFKVKNQSKDLLNIIMKY
ncbi:MAG: stalk domain-containing protein [Bacillota bacterium]